MTHLDASTDEIVAELSRRLGTPEPLIRTRIGLPCRAAIASPPRPELRPYVEDGWSWAGNGS